MIDIVQWVNDLPKWGGTLLFFVWCFVFTGIFAILTSVGGDGYD